MLIRLTMFFFEHTADRRQHFNECILYPLLPLESKKRFGEVASACLVAAKGIFAYFVHTLMI